MGRIAIRPYMVMSSEFGIKKIDTFDGAKPRFLNRGKKRRSVSTLSLRPELRPRGIPRALVLSAVEGSDRGVEWVDSERVSLTTGILQGWRLD